MNKNKLRRGRNKNLIITFGIIAFIIIFSFGMYLAYCYISYLEYANIKKMSGINDFQGMLDFVTSPKKIIQINMTVILTMLKFQVTKFWWLYVVAFLIALMNQNNKDEYHGMEHGSASWADKYDEKLFKDKTGIPIALNTYVTIENAKGKYYASHNINEVIIGGSGAGKSYRKIKPDIMQMYGSYVVTDPKGELYRDTAKILTSHGYKIRVLNLININLSNSYNPFEYMAEEQDVLNVADLFMQNSAGDGEKTDFWVGAAQDMLVAIMVYLWKNENELKTFGRVLRLVNSIQYNKNGRIDDQCELARCFKAHSIEHPNDVVTVNWASIQGTPHETLGSICKTLSTRLRLWAVEDVDELTSVDEMKFDMVGKEKTAIFLIIPAARQTYKVIANIFYSQLFERLMFIANRDYNGRLPMLVSCELDEFANIGKIPNFNETLSVVRSHNIRICIVLQGLSQLKSLYEKTWESIIGNCSIFTFLGTNDMDSKEYVSKKLGKTTVRVDSRSYNRGGKSGGGGSDSESYVQRDLLAPDEIPIAIRSKGKVKKYGGYCIIFIDEYRPFFIPKYDTQKHPLISQTGSSFKKDIVNNTNIEETYSVIKKSRSDKYKQEMIDFFAIAAEKKVESEKKIADSVEAEQKELAEKYSDLNFEDIIDEDDFKNSIDASTDVVPVIDRLFNNNSETKE